MEKALQSAGKRRGKILIDGIADSGSCYRLAKEYNKVLLTPPKRGAILRKEVEYESRNETIRIIRGLGKLSPMLVNQSVTYVGELEPGFLFSLFSL